MNEVYHGVIMDIMGGMVGKQWDRNDIGMNLSEHSLGKNQFHALVLSSIFRQNHCYHSYPLEPPSHHHPISYSTVFAYFNQIFQTIAHLRLYIPRCEDQAGPANQRASGHAAHYNGTWRVKGPFGKPKNVQQW